MASPLSFLVLALGPIAAYRFGVRSWLTLVALFASFLAAYLLHRWQQNVHISLRKFKAPGPMPATAIDTSKIERLGPGSVIIRQALSKEVQIWLAQYAMHAGTDAANGGGFWRTVQGQQVLNATSGRGRLYQPISRYPSPDVIKRVCLDLVRVGRTKAEKLPDMDVTHLLLLYYATAEGMSWHRDTDPNDGDNDHPIVSISLGNTSEFGYKPLLAPEKTIAVQSGDVLIWGGPQRMLEHTVRGVKMGSAPDYLQPIIADARINFTFRSAPNIRILGKESQFASDKYWVDQ